MPKGNARDALSQSVGVLKLWSLSILVFGLYLLIQAPLMILSHDYTAPSYVHDNHHLCHVYSVSLFVLVWWWLALVVLLRKQAAQFVWARRLYGFPVVLLCTVGVVTGWYVFVTFSNHDEVTFVSLFYLLAVFLTTFCSLGCCDGFGERFVYGCAFRILLFSCSISTQRGKGLCLELLDCVRLF